MKLALITGGSKGLGEALVQLYAEMDWEVREFSRTGTGSQHIDCDFSDPTGSTAALEDAFAELAARPWSDVVLINNVGTLHPMGPLSLSAPEAWQENLQINLGSAVTASGLFLQHFGPPSGRRMIVNVTSGAATSAYHGWSLYCASKAGIEAFTRCVALEQAIRPNPVTVINIRPGVIDTDMQSTIRSQSPEHFKEREKFVQLKAEGQLLSPQLAAQKVLEVIASRPRSGETFDVRD